MPLHRAVAAGRRLGRRALERAEGTALAPVVAVLHDGVGRAIRIVADPDPHPELDDAASAFGRRVPLTDGGRVLVHSQRRWPSHTAMDSTIAAALALRGAHVELLTCGGELPACEIGRPGRELPKPCHHCAGYQHRFLTTLGLPIWTQAQLVTDTERREARRVARNVADPREHVFHDLPLGRIVEPAVAWKLHDAAIRDDRHDRGLFRDFLAAGMAMVLAAERVLDAVRPEVVFALSGTFMEEAVTCAVGEQRGIRYVTYEAGPSPGTWFFSRARPASEYAIDDLWTTRAADPMTRDEDAEIDAVLRAREGGVGVHAGTWRTPTREEARAALDLPEQERVTTLFTNVGWDTAAFGRATAFKDDLDFIDAFLEAARHGPGQYVLRVHPGETPLGSRTRLAPLLRRTRDIPANLRIIGPDERVSSYGLIDASDVVVVYTSTVGIEAAVRGKPVVVGARTHYARKGFTHDIDHREELAELLCGPVPAVEPGDVAAARRYAHLFFCRALLPFSQVVYDHTRTRLTYASLDDLAPGRDPVLDVIADVILDDAPAVRPCES